MTRAIADAQRPDPVGTRASRIKDLVELTKPGITRLVVLTTAVGFYLAWRGPFDLVLLVHALVGTGLAASGTNALNQYREREIDGRMRRTENRPLPAGRLTPREALWFSSAISLLGLAELALFVNAATVLVVAASLALYIFVYTPLKRLTPFATLIGAVPGALPVVAGWTATGRPLDAGAWALFGILFLWQLPHFLALAWMYREDYRASGLAMLTVFDRGGERTARQIFIYTLALLPVSLLPSVIGLTGTLYFLGALTCGIAFLAVGAAWVRDRTDRRAHRLFLASVVYLPVLLVLMTIDKLPG